MKAHVFVKTVSSVQAERPVGHWNSFNMTELTQLDEIEENCVDPGRMQNISGGSLLRKILAVRCHAYSPKICTLQF